MARPHVYNTKELVHNALLIGKKKFQIIPPMISRKPACAIFNISRSVFLPPFFKNVPVNTPIKQVPMAGIVPNNPSGSQVLDWDQRWLVVNTVLSTHAPRLV